jgi:hypothetical protein
MGNGKGSAEQAKGKGFRTVKYQKGRGRYSEEQVIDGKLLIQLKYCK